MTFYATTRWGPDEREPSISRMREIINQLDAHDDEHVCVSLKHESEWSLGAYPSGLLVWENFEADAPRHMKYISRAQVLELWLKLAEGRIAEVEAEPWLPGYGD